jgi:hypothetical protein|tara:strand:+ start:634 stop:825 length:192 start_codon:yes stop_codon:yes gene_type:complete
MPAYTYRINTLQVTMPSHDLEWIVQLINATNLATGLVTVESLEKAFDKEEFVMFEKGEKPTGH